MHWYGVKCSPQYPIVRRRQAGLKKGHKEANTRPMFCPQPQMLYVCFCALNHFNLYICLKRSFWLSLYLCGFEGTCEGGITPPISALITPTTDPSNHCLGVGRSCSLVGGILSGSPTIVSILDLLLLTSNTISENAKRHKTNSQARG